MTPNTNTAIRSICRSAPVDDALTIFKEDGLVLIQGFLDSDTVTRLNLELDDPVSKLKPGLDHSNEFAQEFYGHGTRRVDNVSSLSETFREHVLDDEYMHTACTKIFEDSGPYWLNTAQLIDIGPGNNPQPLHRDQWGWPIFAKGGPDTPEVIVNFFIGLGKCTDANGSTRVIPGSHIWPNMAEGASPDMTIAAEMDAGDCLLFSGKLLHGGGSNSTKDSHRKALSVSIISSCCTPEEANPLVFDKSLLKTLKPRVQSMLGLAPQYTAGSVIWHQGVNAPLPEDIRFSAPTKIEIEI